MKKRTRNRILTNVLSPVIAAAAIVAVWQIAAAAVKEPLLLPTPIQTLAELADTLSRPYFYRAFFSTLGRGAWGFLLSLALCLAAACGGFLWRPARRFLKPVVAVLRAVPTMSVILFMLLWTNAYLTPVLVSTLVVFPVLYSGLTAAYDGIDPQLTEYARLTKISRPGRLMRVELPLCLPSFLETCASAASLNIKLLIAAEVLAQTRRSIGLLMQNAQINFETGKLLALTLAVVAAAAAIEAVLTLLKKITERALFG